MRRRALLGSAATGTLTLAAGCVSPTSLLGTDPRAYDPLGTVPVDGAAETVVGDDGDTAYVAATEGFAAVDVSDPAEPTVLTQRRDLEVDGRPLTEILDLKVSGDRLVVPGPANPAGFDEFEGFALYDVSDPGEPVRIGEYETGYHIHNCYLDDEYLYVVRNGEDGNPLVVFDVGEDDPEEIGRWSVLEYEPAWADVEWRLHYLHDVYVHDDIAVLAYWNAGTFLLDVSEPADPEYVSHVSETDVDDQREVDGPAVDDAYFGLPGNDHYSAVDDAGDLLAVGRESWAGEDGDPVGAGGIDLFDVRDPTEPTLVASVEPPATHDASYRGGMWTTAHNFELREDRLYSSWYQGGVKIHDVSDPGKPTELAWWREPDIAGFWTARVADPGETFVASSTELIPNASTAGSLYVFPIEEGDQADPPSLTDA